MMLSRANRAYRLQSERPMPFLGDERSGATVVLDALVRNGVDTVFGYPGGAVIPLYDELVSYDGRIKHVLARHEQGAVHAAQGYARASGRVGVVFATSGPGASNLLTGLMDAYIDSTPLVVFSGQVVRDLIGKDAFQECDMMGMTNPVTKHNYQVRDVDTLEETIEQAFFIASTGRPGPVYVELPKDIQMTTTRHRGGEALDLPFYQASRPLDAGAVERAAHLVKASKRPLLLVGQGTVLSGACQSVRRLAEDLKIPVVTTIMAKGAFDETSPLSLGCLGMHGRRVANYAVVNSDLLITFGCRFSDRITGDTKSFASGKKIIHVDIDPYEIGKNVPVTVQMTCDAAMAARALGDELGGFEGGWAEWTERLAGLREVCNRCVKDSPSAGLPPKSVMSSLNAVVEDGDIVATGVGQHQMFASHYLTRRRPRTFIVSGGAGTMGFCLPAAIGAALAKPEAKVWALDGDGSFQMNIQELSTLSGVGVKNVVVVLLDNGCLGMVRQWQELFWEKRYSAVSLEDNPDFVKVAEAYGFEALSAADEDGLKEALRLAKKAEKNVLIHVRVEQTSNIKPMVPPGGKLTDFFGYCIDKPGRFFSEREMRDASQARGKGK